MLFHRKTYFPIFGSFFFNKFAASVKNLAASNVFSLQLQNLFVGVFVKVVFKNEKTRRWLSLTSASIILIILHLRHIIIIIIITIITIVIIVLVVIITIIISITIMKTF